MFNLITATVNAFSEARFGPWKNLGDVLLLGEGNLSFSKSLLSVPDSGIATMTTTTFEKTSELSEDGRLNAQTLKNMGADVLHNIDATHLERYFDSHCFDTVVFQFPNVASREAKYGHNLNHILVRNVLRSAHFCLKPSGRFLITLVDSPYYEGAFQLDEAAQFAGYKKPESYPFDPQLFKGYTHVNTNEEEDSALRNHNTFVTWVFRPR